jgi:hypothetical protein
MTQSSGSVPTDLLRLWIAEYRVSSVGAESGVWIWRSPHHRYYLVDHAGTTALGKLDD